MFRYLVAHLPCFRLERCGWHSQQLVALVAEQRSALRVQVATPAALHRGVRPGMTLTEARALVPDLLDQHADLDGEAEDLDAVVEQLLRVSPNVTTLPPDAVVAEISRSTTAVVGGTAGGPRAGAERALLERVRIRLEQLGHLVTVVIADDPAMALACAAWGRQCTVVPPGQGSGALAPLPLPALDLPAEEQSLLQGLGIDTVAAFAALPPSAVAGRLSPVGVAAHALARGRIDAPAVGPWLPDTPLVLTQQLPDPVCELDALLFVINALLRDACARLAAAGRAAGRLRLRFGLDDGQCGTQDLSVRLGEPTRDARRMLALLRLRLERFQLAAPVDSLSIELPEPVAFHGRQHGLLDGQRQGDALPDVVAHLQDALGASAVMVPRLVDRHRPEGAWQPGPWVSAEAFAPPPLPPSQPGMKPMIDTLTEGSLAAALPATATDPVAEWMGHPRPVPPRRPPLLLPAPLAVDVRTPAGGLPLALQAEGRWIDVVAARGPERVDGEWWNEPYAREYWLVTLSDGRRAWIYREDGRWALHGWWDR